MGGGASWFVTAIALSQTNKLIVARKHLHGAVAPL